MFRVPTCACELRSHHIATLQAKSLAVGDQALKVSNNTSSYSFHYNKDQWQALATEHNTICTQKVDVVYKTHLIYNVIQVLIHRGKTTLQKFGSKWEV